jgi:hypothetical protein
MKRQVYRWVILGSAMCCLAYGLRRKHTIQVASEGSPASGQIIGDAELVVFATNGGVKRSDDGQLARVLSASGNGEGPKACPT